MHFFRKPSKTNVENMLASAVGPSPWYLNPSKPVLSTEYGKAYWKHLPKTGKTLLEVTKHSVLAIAGYYQFIKPVSDSCFLHWCQTSSTAILLSFYDSNKMMPINDLDAAFDKMDKTKYGFFTNGGLIASVEILTTDIQDKVYFDFPEPINQQNEILILADSPLVEGSGGHRCIIVAGPSNGIYQIYPQDWFNKGDFDFGYQWITRVTRDPATNRVVGDGIRIGQFLLDESLRNLDKWILRKV